MATDGAQVLRIHQREPLNRSELVPPVTIHIGDRLPPDDEPQETQRCYRLDARALADTLWDALPGGTLDVLLAELMQRRSSLLRVGLLSVEEIAAAVGCTGHDDRLPPVGRLVYDD